MWRLLCYNSNICTELSFSIEEEQQNCAQKLTKLNLLRGRYMFHDIFINGLNVKYEGGNR